jgi:IstB-like ATP binding protein
LIRITPTQWCHREPDARQRARPVRRARRGNGLVESSVPRLAATLLHRLTAQQSSDLYELIIERYRRTSFVFTSNRGVDEWLGLFDDPILGNSALDRLAHGAYQIVIEGTSYRANKAPKITDEVETEG